MSAEPWIDGAALGDLPGVPAEGGSRTRWATRHGVERRRASSGKGWEYRVESLPEAARAALRTRIARELAAETARALVPAGPRDLIPAVEADQEPLADWQREIASARLALLTLAERLAAEQGWRMRRAFEDLVRRAAAGTLPAGEAALVSRANARAGAGRGLTAATLYRWQAARAGAAPGGELAALAPAPAVVAEVRPAWLAPVLRAYQLPSKPTLAAAYRGYMRGLQDPEERRAVPPLRTVQRHVASLPAEVREYGRMGPRALRSIQPFVRRTTDGLWPMDVVTVDGHSAKCYALRPDSGKRVRPEVTTYLDLCTRRVVGWSAWWAESQFAIWLALRSMVLDAGRGLGGVACGVAALQYSDNGAYRGETHQAVLARLGTTPTFSTPYRAQARGAIERLNSSLWVPLARTQPTYCGRDTDQERFKKALAKADEGAGALDWAGWLGACEAAISEYNARPHSSLKRGRERLSPDRAWAIALDEGWAPTALGSDDLHDLLPSVVRTVARGEVSLPWGKYQGECLRPWQGRLVRVHYDPADGAAVWACQVDGRLIGQVGRDAMARGYFPPSQVEHARAQREAARVGRLERRIEIATAEETPVLIGETYSDLPDLVLAGVGGAVRSSPHPTAAGVGWGGAVRSSPHPTADGAVVDLPVDDGLDRLADDPSRYTAWLILRDRDRDGDLLTPREATFLERFGASGYCRAMEEMRAEFDARMGGRA